MSPKEGLRSLAPSRGRQDAAGSTSLGKICSPRRNSTKTWLFLHVKSPTPWYLQEPKHQPLQLLKKQASAPLTPVLVLHPQTLGLGQSVVYFTDVLSFPHLWHPPLHPEGSATNYSPPVHCTRLISKFKQREHPVRVFSKPLPGHNWSPFAGRGFGTQIFPWVCKKPPLHRAGGEDGGHPAGPSTA